MRLTLVIHSLNCGGAERVMTIMANYWAARNWEITLLTLDDGQVPPFYDLDHRVRHIPSGLASDSPTRVAGLHINLKRAYALRRAISASCPKAVISFMDRTNALTLLATRGLNIPVAVSERSDPAMNSPGKVWEHIRQWTYPGADAVVVQSKGALDYFSHKLDRRVLIIPNPVLLPPTNQTQFDVQFGKPLIVSVGRLVRLKGFDLLLRAFAPLKDKHPEWTLAILGEGPMRAELESLRYRLRLFGRVLLPGLVKNPYGILKRADLFVLTSRFEGFPNALCEAMACGLPVISADCPSGPQEIVRHETDGLLVPSEDVDALTAAIDRLMSSGTERKRLALRAPEVTERFAIDKVMQMWEETLSKIIREKNHDSVRSRTLEYVGLHPSHQRNARQ